MTSCARIYSDMIDDLHRDLSGRSESRRQSAVERCTGLPEDLLLGIISRLLMQYNRHVTCRWLVCIAGAIGVVSAAYLVQGNTLFAFGVLGLLVAHHYQVTYTHTGCSLQALLLASEDKRLIPMLLLKYSDGDACTPRPQQQRVRDIGLAQLLPYVCETDEALWTSQMRKRLAGLLHRPCRHRGLTSGVLHALKEIGDETALPALTSIVQPRGVHKALRGRKQAEFQEEARGTVLAIESRGYRKQQQAMLLRASASVQTNDSSLPRPAAETGSAERELLLTSTPHTDRAKGAPWVS